MILETERLYLREMEQSDFESLCKILQDEETIYAYEGAFDDMEVQEWLDRQISRYQKWGFGLWAVVLKETGEMIGQCGLTMQPWKDDELLEVGYLFQRSYWHNGYATEAARACKKYAFEVLNADEVCSIIRDTNVASQNVAIRNGMTVTDTWTKHYRGVDMPHDRYVVRKQQECCFIREIRKTEYSLLKDFLYEAIFVPEGVEAPPKSIIDSPQLQVYIAGFGKQKDDRGFIAEVDGKIVGAVWVRIMNDYGHIDNSTPSFAIALYKEYRGIGIGTKLMKKMLSDLKMHGYEKASLAVQKANYAVRMYQKVGFEIVDENEEEYIMVCQLWRST